jgi:cyanophycinase
MLIAIGGGLDLHGERKILKRLLSEARGQNSSVCVVTTATNYPEEARQKHYEAFTSLGIADLTFLHLRERAEANDPLNAQTAGRADIIFFTGGDQLQLTKALEGTRFLKAVGARINNGAIVAGTSAGAAALSSLMIYGEQSTVDDPSEGKEVVSLKTGFGFAGRYIIDTHFSQRNRLDRLFSKVAENPGAIGLGIDEDTAAIIHADNTMEAIGSGNVTIIDDVSISSSRINDQHTPLTIRAGESYIPKPR